MIKYLFLLFLAAIPHAPVVAAKGTLQPHKPIRLIVGLPAGGPADLASRVTGEKLSSLLNTTVVVENRVGGNGNIAAEHVVRSPADGHTLLMGATAITISPALYKNLRYDLFRDLAPVGGVYKTPLLVTTSNQLGVKSVQELVARAKAAPHGLRYGSGGSGSTTRLGVELFAQEAGLSLTHVPYRGTTPLLADLVGGHVDMAFDTLVSSLPMAREGRIRALAVTSLERSPVAPGLPTLAELGYPDFNVIGWFGLFAPSGTPSAVLDQVSTALQKALKAPEVVERFTTAGGEVFPGTRAEFAGFVGEETRRWGAIVRQRDISAE
jgi:tripartite-type tricarboxylate transporter receptor subunit TctC